MIAAGGTGGHVYPALAVVEALYGRYPDAEVSFVGTVNGFERPLVEQSGVAFAAYHEVQAGPIHGVNPLRLISSAGKLAVGLLQSYRLLGRRRPQVILSTGGWVSFPLAAAARLRGIPVVIYLPDIEPALTIKVLRRFARKVAVTVEQSRQFFAAGQTVVTGYPLRADLMRAEREDAIRQFSLDPSLKTLLVFGGSRGARVINQMIGAILEQLLAAGIQVIHVTGTLDWERSQAQMGRLAQHEHYHAYPYLHSEMGLAYAAADLAVCRAGASVLAEFPYFHLPSILIPLAYSWRYQQINADYLAERGAAIHLDESDAPQQLLPLLLDLFENSEKLQAMAQAAKTLSQSDGADNLAELLAQLTRENA